LTDDQSGKVVVVCLETQDCLVYLDSRANLVTMVSLDLRVERVSLESQLSHSSLDEPVNLVTQVLRV